MLERLDALLGERFTAQPTELEIGWWRHRWRRALDPLVEHSTWFWHATFRATAGTVLLELRAGDDTLHWLRHDKRWSEEQRIGWHRDDAFAGNPWVTATAPPPGRRTLHDASAPAPTGRIQPLVDDRDHDDQPQRCAILALAKCDTHFRRVGMWGVRSALLVGLPPAVAMMLQRGRGGTLTSTDLDS